MSEIKNTLAILRARWPEVVLIIGISVLHMLANPPLRRLTKASPFLGVISSGCVLVFAVITILLTVAFQRTVYLEGRKRQSPIVLLRIGKHFFGRIIVFGLLYMPAYVILAYLVFLVIKPFAAIETSFFETAKTAPLLYHLCFTVAALILIKPVLFMFPIIIVMDCRIFASFKLLKRCRLSDANELVILFLAATALTALWALLPSAESTGAILQGVLRVVLSITQRFFGLMIAVMGVRFVGSLDLASCGRVKGPDPEDLLRPPTAD